MSTSKVRTALVAVIKQTNPSFDPSRFPDSPKVQRGILGDLIISSNTPFWNDEVLSAVDQVYVHERQAVRPVSWRDITDRAIFHRSNINRATEIGVWNGDITSLQIDAIVNAANDSGLGCFQPEHRCIDNVIHRAAGPRLRKACRIAMETRGYPLRAGTPPIVTPAFHLPSNHVIHVTGPQIAKNRRVTEQDRELLTKAYEGSLDACLSHGIRSVAFCGISTGLFGFPKEEAVNIAIATTLDWLEQHPNNNIDSVIFDVFSDTDEALYREKLDTVMQRKLSDLAVSNTQNLRSGTVRVAKKWIDEADAVLICAGAGMSVKEGEMVYVEPRDFAKFYPYFLKWGYTTSYEAMGLGFDPSVPMAAKWALWAKHMHLQRWKFEPNEGYDTLQRMVRNKDYFVLTSNVDACFERSGFSKDRIYTPQGEWTYYQCKRACRKDAVFDSRPMLDRLLPHISDDGFIPETMIPKCKYCGGDVFGNVRADGNFLHGKYEKQNDALRSWMQSNANSNRTIAVIEVGAGFNTPTVTRFPVESFARVLGERGRLIRINPSDPEVPSDLNQALSFDEGWQALKDIESANCNDSVEDGNDLTNHNKLERMTTDYNQTVRFAQHLGHFDWNTFLKQLKD